MRGQPPGSATGSLPEYPPALGARRSRRPFALALESTRKKRELELVTLAGRHQISDLGLIRRAGTGSDAWRTGGSRVVDSRALCFCGGASLPSPRSARALPHGCYRAAHTSFSAALRRIDQRATAPHAPSTRASGQRAAATMPKRRTTSDLRFDPREELGLDPKCVRRPHWRRRRPKSDDPAPDDPDVMIWVAAGLCVLLRKIRPRMT